MNEPNASSHCTKIIICIKKTVDFFQTLDIFRDSTYRGPVILQTKKTKNFYFTPLGRSYTCQHGEDQGPLNLFNEDDEMVGNMTLYNSKFQPFVKRAKGKWGPGERGGILCRTVKQCSS